MPAAFVGTTGKANGTTALAPAWSGDQPRTAGNALFAIVVTENNASVASTCTTPAGWTLDISQTGSSTTPRMGIWIFRKTAAGGDAAPSFTLNASGVSMVYLYEVSGLDTTGTTLDAAAAGTATTSPTTGSTATPTSATAGWALCAAGGRAAAAGVATWTGATVVESGTGSTVNVFLSVAAIDLGAAGAQSFKEAHTNASLYATVAGVYIESGAPAAVPDRWGDGKSF
jgi:hypothetical protein